MAWLQLVQRQKPSRAFCVLQESKRAISYALTRSNIGTRRLLTKRDTVLYHNDLQPDYIHMTRNYCLTWPPTVSKKINLVPTKATQFLCWANSARSTCLLEKLEVVRCMQQDINVRKDASCFENWRYSWKHTCNRETYVEVKLS